MTQNQRLQPAFCLGEHPRLYFSKDDIQRVQMRVKESPKLAAWLNALEAKAAALGDQPLYTEEYANSLYSQHGRFYDLGRQVTEFAETFGFLYQLTGKRAYMEKLRDCLLHYAGFAAWVGPSNKDRKTPWHSELSTTRMTEGFALGYDCIEAALTPSEKENICGAMLNLGIRPLLEDWVLPKTRIHALDSMGHNWWAVCIGLAGVGLAAIYEQVPQAEEWMNRIVESLRGFCSYQGELLLNKVPNFDNHGLFYESAGYFNYGVGELLHFQFVFRRCFSEMLTLIPLEQVCSAFLSLTYPRASAERPLLILNFGDSRFYQPMFLLPLYALLNAGMGDGLSAGTAPLLSRAYRQDSPEPDFFDFLYYDTLWGAVADSVPSLPLDSIYEQSGYAILRDSWKNDATLLGVRCGYSWNHAHDDSGSFMLCHRGVPLLVDSGAPEYADPLYHSYFLTAQAHNVVLANGRGADPENNQRGTKFPGTVSHFIDAGWASYLLADATGPQCERFQRNYRSFLRIDGDLYLILDDLLTYQPARFEWLLHYCGTAEHIGENMLRIEKDDAAVRIHTLFPNNTAVTEKAGYIDAMQPPDSDGLYQWYVEHPYISISDPEVKRVGQFLHLIQPEGGAPVSAGRLECTDAIGVRLTRGATTTDVFYNMEADGRCMHINSNNCLDGWETDAYILAIRRQQDRPTQYMMLYGSYLRRDGRICYDSCTKDFAFGTLD